VPEGDTVHKLAHVLARALTGRRLELVWLRDRGGLDALTGHEVRAVEALGKHLLIGVAPPATARPRWVLHNHLGMKGRWDRYRPGETWERPETQAGVRLETGRRLYVCFRPMVVELLRRGELAGHPSLRRLGPDLLAETCPIAEIVARARRRVDLVRIGRRFRAPGLEAACGEIAVESGDDLLAVRSRQILEDEAAAARALRDVVDERARRRARARRTKSRGRPLTGSTTPT